MWQGVGDRVSRESIWGVVQKALDPLSHEVVCHDLAFEALEAWILDLVQSVIVEYQYEGVVISNNSKVGETREE